MRNLLIFSGLAVFAAAGYSGSLRQAAVVNQDGTINSPTNPATGQGFVPNALSDGTLLSGPFQAPIQLRVNVAGRLPGSDRLRLQLEHLEGPVVAVFRAERVSRLWQINAYIPRAVVPGTRIPLIIVAGVQTHTDPGTFSVYITVK
jgi:hypothetical protein